MVLSEYLQKYIDTFGENFPIFGFMAVSEDEIINTIKDCLNRGKPYELYVKDGVYY